MRLPRKEFERLVENALKAIPREFRDLAKNVEITIRSLPGAEAADLDDAGSLLGLYCGPSLAEMESPLYGSALPAQIVLYQRNLESISRDGKALRRQVSLTLRHELAHHFGFTDEELETRWPEGA